MQENAVKACIGPVLQASIEERLATCLDNDGITPRRLEYAAHVGPGAS